MKHLKQEKGAALVGVMLTLLVLTLLGTSAFLNSVNELKISSNYQQSLQALYAAEAGLQELLAAYRQTPSAFLKKQTGLEMNFPINETDRPSLSGNTYWIKELRYDAEEIPKYVEVIIFGKDKAKAGLARLRATISCSQTGSSDDPQSVFKLGIVTAGRMNLSGPLELSGALHANQGFTFDSSDVIAQLKKQQTILSQSLDPLGADYLPAMAVPMVSDKIMEGFRALAREKGNQILFGQQTLSLAGDQKGQVIFVDGQVLLNATNLSGIMLIATGSITLNGTTVINEQGGLDTAFIAGGNIIINESSQIAGMLWSNQSIKKMGSGKLKGIMVCQGDIDQREGLQFERYAQMPNPLWSPTSNGYSFTVTGWSQI